MTITNLIFFAIFLVSINSHHIKISSRTNCVCVSVIQCLNITHTQHRVNLSQMTDSDIQCGSLLKSCCHKRDIISEPTTYLPSQGCGYRNSNGIGFILENSTLESQYGEFPWMVEILSRKFMFQSNFHYVAGGSLIHPSVVITATHKILHHYRWNLKVRVGEWDRSSNDEPYPYHDHKVSRIVLHDKFKQRSLVNGVALLFLKSPINIQKDVNTVCIPPLNFQFPENSPCFVTGWGRNKIRNPPKIDILKKVEIPILSDDNCNDLLHRAHLGTRFRLHKSYICAGGESGNALCSGFGGSPLVCPIPDNEDRYYIAGIVGGGLSCGKEDSPAIFIEVAHFHDWINAKIVESFPARSIRQY